MAHTHTRATRRGALAREDLVYRQLQPIRRPSPSNRNYLAFAPRDKTSVTPYSQGFQASRLAQPTPLREPLGRSNRCDSKTFQAYYGYPRCNLNLFRLFRLSLSLTVFGRFFLFLHPRSHKPTTAFTYYVILNPRVECGGTPVPRGARSPTILCHAVRPFVLLPRGPRSPDLLTLPSCVTCGRPCGAESSTTPTSSCARLLRYSHVKFTGRRFVGEDAVVRQLVPGS